MARFGGTCHAQRNVSSGELVNHALLLSLLAMLATPSGLVWPDGSLQDHGGEETARKRNYQACLYGLATCQLASLSPTERQAVKEAAEKRARALMAVPPVAGRSFKGYACTVDCSGHEAGYQWAEDNGIDDESDCTGNSQSFIEGCIAYVEENSDDGYGLTEDDEEYNEDEGEDSDDN